jgi:hypothetical protein
MGPKKKGASVMKTFIIACVAAIVIAIVGWGVLDSVQKPAEQAFSTPYARV